MTPSITVGISLPHRPLLRLVMAALLLAAICFACAACSTASTSRATNADNSGSSDSMVVPSELEEGRALYERRCATCHELFAPQEYAPAAWPRYVKRYGPRSGLNAAQREKVSAYLQWAATR